MIIYLYIAYILLLNLEKELKISQMTNFILPNWKSLQMTILNLMKMAESSSKG